MAITLPDDPKHSPALRGVRAKLRRAQDHFDDINSRINAVFSTQPDGESAPIGSEVDENRQSITFRLQEVKPLDPDLPLVIGDCLHNLRSALDHLVLQLAVLKGTPLAEAADKTSFPVCLSREDFRSKSKNFAALIRSEALTEIKKLQPYKASNPPETSFLWQLSEMDIIDKHRLLVVISQKFKITELDGTFGAFRRIVPDPLTDWKPREAGAELFTVEFAGPPTKMNMQIKTAMAVQFANTGLVCDGGIVQDVINGCGGCVEKIIDDFGKRFFGERP
jgi:hypothetical protein